MYSKPDAKNQFQIQTLTLQELCLSAYHPARMSYAEYGHLQASASCALQRLWHRGLSIAGWGPRPLLGKRNGLWGVDHAKPL